MVRIHRTILTAAMGLAMIAQSAVAQSSASLTHTVSVTVPPRVKVQVTGIALQATPMVGNSVLNASTRGISLSINATRAWVLSIGSVSADSSQKAQIRWSRDASSGYSALTGSDVAVASGTLSSEPKSAQLFFRSVDTAARANASDISHAPVVLTVAAP